MSLDKVCFINVSFKPKYIEVQQRLKESILKIYPEAKLFFWSDELPPNAKPMADSLYGFKVHAIQYAIDKGYTKIVWMDSCNLLNGEIDNLLNIAKEKGVIAAKDSNKLYKYCSDSFKGYTGEIDKEWNLIGGSLYVFDFENQVAKNIFEEWKQLESRGYFGSQKMIMAEKNDGVEKCGHRMDETCMAWLIYKNGVTPFEHDVISYNQGESSTIIKKHFIKEGEKWYNKQRAIHEHTVDTGLFNEGVCIDVGCRNFNFSKAMQEFGLKVLAYDVEEMDAPKGIEFKNCAVLNYNGVASIRFTEDKQGTHISDKGHTVFCIDINSIYEEYPNVDILKLDCEGSEYLILSDENFKPIPKQISVEFHAHSQKALHDKYYHTCMGNLLAHYKAVKHEWTEEHCAGFNYWDSLFIRKDLL